MNRQLSIADPADRRPRQRWIGFLAVGAVVTVLVVADLTRSDRASSEEQDSQVARATPRAPGSPTPVPTSSFVSNPPIEPWNPAWYAFDWPGPPRPEPAGPPTLVPLVHGDQTHWDQSEGRWEGLEHIDPAGDGVTSLPWLDIVEVRAGWGALAAFTLELAADMPRPPAGPDEQWMAFGIVLDTNHDGLSDIRLGMDNMPDREHRAWRTDLRSGQTAWKAGPSYGRLDQGLPRGTSNDTYYPGEEGTGPNRALMRYLLEPGEADAHFYAWASLIEDGRVVATDYAPDAGWLVFEDDGDLPLLGNHWDIESVTSPEGTASVQDWFTMRATFSDHGELTIDACERIEALATVDGSLLWLRAVTSTPIAGCPPEMQAIDRIVRAVVQAPVIEYTIERGVLVLRAGDNSVRLIGSTEP